jgi:hypothetical protein
LRAQCHSRNLENHPGPPVGPSQYAAPPAAGLTTAANTSRTDYSAHAPIRSVANILIGLSVLAALALVAFALHEWVLVKYSRAETPLQFNGTPASIPDIESSVSFPIRGNIADFNATLKQIVPHRLSGTTAGGTPTVSGPNINMDYDVTQTSIRLHPGASGDIQASVDLHVTGRVVTHIGTHEFQHSDFQTDANVFLTLQPMLKTDWTLDLKGSPLFSVDSFVRRVERL